MKSVLIVVGHWNIQNLTSEGLRSWRSLATLRGGTGATNEMLFHKDQWMPKLRDLLISKGIQVYITDAIYHADTYARDYDLAILGHYDGGSQSYTITPDTGWQIKSITRDGTPQTVTNKNGMSYNLTSVSSDVTLAITFEKKKPGFFYLFRR